MRTVNGLAEAREALLEGRGLDFDSVADEVMEATSAALGGRPASPAEAVDEILRRVREGGDEALRELALSLDGVEPESFEVPKSAIAEAYGRVPDELVRALEVAAKRCTRFHQASRPEGWIDFSEGYGEMLVPVGSVGAYVPRGLASTVLMTAIPARVAGVDEVIVCTPPGADGLPDPAMLVAADLAGVNRVFGIGGAQAVAAMAYGTESVPKVDLVCGPGNVFVTLAKKALFGEVGIEGLYGPTETTVIADDTANPTLCAADLLAQAEHDALAMPVLITTSAELAEAVQREIGARADGLERGETAMASIEGRGAIAIVEDIDQALDLANDLAPEHLCLMVRQPWRHVGRVRNAGALFIGEFSHEVLGDYVAGPSHVMPTAGTARFNSGVSVRSFLKVMPVVGLDDETAMSISRHAAVIARAEGLTGHAEAAEIRHELEPK
jgi:histidinol dehydrogenase